MRKQLALWLLPLLSYFPLQAQLAPGSIAPDFTVTDVDGQNWHLYDLLADDKIVVVEFFSTWCGPCWSYHNGGALQSLFASHGPGGDDRLRVFLIEGDPSTNLNCIHGYAGCNSFSPGDWTENTPYPVVDNAFVANNYESNTSPTLYAICPNKRVYEVKTLDAAGLWAKASGCPVASGTDNAGIFDYRAGTPYEEICGLTELHPAFSLINLGAHPLTNATLDLLWNGTAVQSKSWSGNLGLYGEAAIAFNDLPVSSAGILGFRLRNVNATNDTADDDPANNLRADTFSLAGSLVGQQALLKIHTDDFGAETYWELRNEAGQVLDHGGNSNVGPTGGGQFPGSIGGGPGAYGNNVTIVDTLSLPGSGCYSLHFSDAFGDGICCEYGEGYYQLSDLTLPYPVLLSGGNFEAYDRRVFGMGVTVGNAVVDAANNSLRLWPNPVQETLHLEFSLPGNAQVEAVVFNSLGREIQTRKARTLNAGPQALTFSVQDWPEGIYFLKLTIGAETLTRRITIAR